MGRKGDRAVKEPLARNLYARGHSLTEIARLLDISTTSLARWKEESRRPGQDADDWDLARRARRSNLERLRELFERQLRYVEEIPPDQVTAPMVDALSKLGALVERWDRAEQALRRVRQAVEAPAGGDAASVADEIRRIIRETYGVEV